MQEETVYVEVFDEDNQCINGKCHTEIQRLNHEISEYEEKVLAAKDKYHQSLVTNLKKDVMIQDLENQLKKLDYSKFKGVLTDEAITVLRSFNVSRKKDSIFISTAVKDIYRNDLHRLAGKTFSGRTKQPMTPEKKKVLSALFTERVKNLSDSAERMRKLAKCVKAAIDNINKSKLK